MAQSLGTILLSEKKIGVEDVGHNDLLSRARNALLKNMYIDKHLFWAQLSFERDLSIIETLSRFCVQYVMVCLWLYVRCLFAFVCACVRYVCLHVLLCLC